MTTTKRNLGIIGILLIAVWLLVSTTPAVAKKEKVKTRNVSQITKMHVIKVGDVDGHIIAVYERRGLAFFVDGGVGTYLNRGMFDMTKGKGTAQGYVTHTFEDASTTNSTWQGTIAPREGKRLAAEGTYTYIGGSGRFEGIEGGGKWTAKSFTPYTKDETKSDLITDVTGTYTLPKK